MTSRRSSGSMRAERAVEPTKSENITVTWRRSARASGAALGALDAVATSAEAALPLASARRAAIASRSLRRCPNAATPSSFRSSAVRPGRTVSSISFSRNAASYFPRPRPRSQTTMSMRAPQTQGCRTSSCSPERVSRDAREVGALRRGPVSALRVSRPLAEYYSGIMTNRFGLDLPPDRLRWAAAEGVSQDVIAAVLLLHERSVDEIVPELSSAEFEQVIVL